MIPRCQIQTRFHNPTVPIPASLKEFVEKDDWIPGLKSVTLMKRGPYSPNDGPPRGRGADTPPIPAGTSALWPHRYPTRHKPWVEGFIWTPLSAAHLQSYLLRPTNYTCSVYSSHHHRQVGVAGCTACTSSAVGLFLQVLSRCFTSTESV